MTGPRQLRLMTDNRRNPMTGPRKLRLMTVLCPAPLSLKNTAQALTLLRSLRNLALRALPSTPRSLLPRTEVNLHASCCAMRSNCRRLMSPLVQKLQRR